MQAIINYLDGKKSIIGTIVLGIIGVLASAGVVSVESVYVQIVTLVVGVLTGISFRSAVAKSGPTVATTNLIEVVSVKRDPVDSISR